jgi:hypothetical protein
MHRLTEAGNLVFAMWTPANEQISVREKAKAMARKTAELPIDVNDHTPGAKTTVLCPAKQEFQPKPIQRVREYTRKFETAFPGKHTYSLYNGFKCTEADILAQLRTGMSRPTGTYIASTLLAQICVPVARLRRW